MKMNEQELKEFGLRLKESREAKGISLEELGKLTGTTKGTIWKYERGLREPKASVSIAISNVLEVSWGWLIGEENKKVAEDFSQVKDLYNSLPDSAKEEAIKYLIYLKETRKDENIG